MGGEGEYAWSDLVCRAVRNQQSHRGHRDATELAVWIVGSIPTGRMMTSLGVRDSGETSLRLVSLPFST